MSINVRSKLFPEVNYGNLGMCVHGAKTVTQKCAVKKALKNLNTFARRDSGTGIFLRIAQNI